MLVFKAGSVLNNARRIAFEVLCDVLDKGEYSNLLLPRRLQSSDLAPRDRAFTTELVYGVLRLQGRLDHYASQLSNRPIEDLELQVRVLLRLGLLQLIDLKMPPHAAVNETTEVAKAVVGKSAASFIHAILREVDRRPPTLPLDSSPESLSIRYSHSPWIVRSLIEALGGAVEIENLLQAQNVPAIPTLNALPGRCEENELIEEGAVKIDQSERAFSYKGNPGEIAAVREHRAIVQDLGSQIVVEEFFAKGMELAAEKSGLRWLDLCAGPGGKAAYLDSLITNGEFVANELSSARATLVKNVVRRGLVTNIDGRSVEEKLGRFDRILVDAPCTGLGALRRRPEVRWRRTPQDLANLVTLQRELLKSAASACNVNGIIGYATCSPHPAETKLQVMRFLAEHSHFRRVPFTSSWANSDGDLQLWTHRNGTDSMFLSLLERVS